MARIDGYVRLVQKALPQSATPSVPISDDHTDGTWTYRDIYDREIAINDDGNIYWRALDNIYEFSVASASTTDIYTISATLSGSTAIFTRNDSATYSLDLSTLETQLTNVDYIAFNTTPTVVHSEGTMHWNDTTKTLEVDTENSGVRIEVGQQLYLRVNNQTGSQLDKGKIVYINGQQGNRPTVTLADYSSEATSSKTLGFVAATMSNGQNGYVLTYGILEGINTNSYTPGTTLYLSTSGNWTSTKPDAPNHMVSVGKVINQSTTGSIYVSVQNGYELQELHNVLITGATAGQILQYNGSLWVNGTQSVPNLSEVLTIGNNTGNKDIELNNNSFTSDSDSIRAAGNTYDDARISYEDLGAGAWAPIMKVWNNDLKSHILVTESETQIWNSRVGGIYNHYSNFVQDWNSMSFNVADLTGGGGVTMDIGTNTFFVYSSSLSFEGIKYGSDWSANFTARSLVDKGYVDGLITTPSLSDVMTVGNNTSNKNIIFNNNYGLENSTGEADIKMNEYQIDITHIKYTAPSDYKRGLFQGSGHNGTATITGDNYNTTSDLYRASSVEVTDIMAKMFYQETQISTSNGYQTAIQVYRDSILVNSSYNASTINSNFAGLQYNYDHSANFTARSLVDKAYVDAAVAAGGGGGGGTFSGGTVSNATTFQSDVTFQANVIDENGTSIDMTNIINMTNLALMYNT